MTAEVKFEDGQKQLISELELHCGIMGSQVFRHEGRRDGQGALGGGGPAGGAEDDAGSKDAEGVPGGGGAAVVIVDVPGGGDEFGGPERGGPDGVDGGAWDVRVFGGAAVHLVHTVCVEVTTVVETVDVV